MGKGLDNLIFILPMIAIFYFMIFMPKRKEQQALAKMLSALKKGDRVLTTSGMIGEVFAVKENVVTLRFHDNVRIDFSTAAIAKLVDEKGVEKKEEKPVEAKA